MTGIPHLAVRYHAIALIGCVVASLLPGAVGSAFQPDAWYAALEKSALTPPGFVFPIAWTLLYLSIGVAVYIYAFQASERPSRAVLALFGIQLVLNGAWSWLFFGLHEPGLAMIDLILLWASIWMLAVEFARHSKPAGLLLVPYGAWVTFAGYLNFAIWRAN